MVWKSITKEREDGIAVIRIDRAPRDNGEVICLIEDLSEACEEFSADGSITVVVLTGGPGAFDMGSLAFPLHPEEEEAENLSLTAPLDRIRCPILAALQGRVNGLGLELALSCDIRLAAEGSSFSLPQLAVGSIPFDGGTQRLSRVVGKAKALEMILLAQAIDGLEAIRTGLVNRLVPPHELMPLVMDMASKMALQAPLSMSFAKEAINRGMEMDVQQGLRLEADLYFLLHTTTDRREGIEAFKEKRKPHFTGQ